MVKELESIFISGSIRIRRLDARFTERVSNAIMSGMKVVVGDADGADTSIQSYLMSIGANNVNVYCSGEFPRNNLGDWDVKNIFPDAPIGTRAYYTAKDLSMAEVASFGLMVWDSKSTGTLSNVIRLLEEKKKSVVFVNKSKTFFNVSDGRSLLRLVENMSEVAKIKANSKIGLAKKIEAFCPPQPSFI